jgi:hypothetical protein
MPLIFGRTSSGLMVPVLVDASGRIGVESLGYISGAWQKNPLAFGLSAAVYRTWSSTTLAAGDNTLNDSAVPAGEVWVITNMAARYVGTFATVHLRLVIVNGGVGYVQFEIDPPHNDHIEGQQGWWVLFPGDNLRLFITGATLNDDAFAYATGFRVDIDQ